jgi:hypothetical protein
MYSHWASLRSVPIPSSLLPEGYTFSLPQRYLLKLPVDYLRKHPAETTISHESDLCFFSGFQACLLP